MKQNWANKFQNPVAYGKTFNRLCGYLQLNYGYQQFGAKNFF